MRADAPCTRTTWTLPAPLRSPTVREKQGPLGPEWRRSVLSGATAGEFRSMVQEAAQNTGNGPHTQPLPPAMNTRNQNQTTQPRARCANRPLWWVGRCGPQPRPCRADPEAYMGRLRAFDPNYFPRHPLCGRHSTRSTTSRPTRATPLARRWPTASSPRSSNPPDQHW